MYLNVLVIILLGNSLIQLRPDTALRDRAAGQEGIRPTNLRRTLCLSTAASGGNPAGCMGQFRWPEIFRLSIESSIRAFGDFLHSQKGRDLSDFDS